MPVVNTRKPQLKTDATFAGGMTPPLLTFHVWRKAFHTLDDLAALHDMHFRQLSLGALRRVSTQVALAAFRAHHFAGAGQAKTLGGRLVGLQLVFSSFCFTRHC